MYYQRLLLLFPQTNPEVSAGWYLAVGVVAALMLIAGVRVGQAIISLICVAIGAVVGKLLPGMLGLNWDPAATTVAIALAGGLFGYLSHRWVTGLGLSLLAVVWTTLGFWMASTTPATWSWPRYPGGTAAFLPYLKVVRDQVGMDLCSQIAPFAVIAFLASLALYTLLPRLATMLFWTVSGLTIALLSGMAYGKYVSPEALQRAPTTFQGQTLVMGAITLASVLCQSIRRRPKPQPEPEQPSVRVETVFA